jgi:type I restriction enzyme S subunit
MSDIVGKQFLSKMKGANYPAISQNDVSFTKIPIPSYEEQIDIGNYLTVLDKKIVAESGRKSALDILFSSLLQHLMAGTVRVQVD